jgi:hypothetical protein
MGVFDKLGKGFADPKPVDADETKEKLDRVITAEKAAASKEPVQVLDVEDKKIYYSKYKGYKIGITPTYDSYEYIENNLGQTVKKKFTNEGHQIKFNDGKYIISQRPLETDEHFEKRKKVEEDFLERFMRQNPDRVFSVDPKQTELMKKVHALAAEHKQVKQGNSPGTGRQGVVNVR